jgi:hypothetical protein
VKRTSGEADAFIGSTRLTDAVEKGLVIGGEP